MLPQHEFPSDDELDPPRDDTQAEKGIPILHQKVLLVAVPLAVMLLCHILVTVRLMDQWGVTPRTFTLGSFIGLFTASFFHTGTSHIMANLIPFAVLGALIVTLSRRRYIFSSAYIAFLSACMVYLLARDAEHMGASTLIFGYFAHLLAAAWLEGVSNPHFVLVAAIVSIWFGVSMILTLLSFNTNTSWESHVAGFITGMGSAYHYLIIYGETVTDTSEWEHLTSDVATYVAAPQFAIWSSEMDEFTLEHKQYGV